MVRAFSFAVALALSFSGAIGNAADTVAEAPAEIALPPGPTHWPAATPVGTKVGPVTDAMLKSGQPGTDSWLLYGGNYANFRHSPLKSLTPTSVKGLVAAWAFPLGTLGQMEASPVIYGGVMYVTSSYNRLFALDAKTGALLWRYDHQNGSNLRLCCGPPNRGVGIAGDLVIMGTLDARLIAFNRTTGAIVWNKEVADYKDGFSLTSAPLIVGELAFIGVAGGEYGVRGFFDAYNVATGDRVWRHYTVPAPGEPGAETWAGDSAKTGGAPAWTQGAYDADTDTLFWTVGNPAPDWNGDARKGDNLYSDSILALEPKTGKLKWHFQFTPHDVWDYDGNTQVFLVDATVRGKTVKAIAQANRNGYFYLLDRATGKFLRATPYLEKVNWATIDKKGRPVVSPHAWPNEDPKDRVCPSNLGGMNGSWTGAFNPDLGLAFIPAMETCQTYAKGLPIYTKGMPFLGGLPDNVDKAKGDSYGNLNAVDVSTGLIKWRYRDTHPMMGGALSTAGGVVFTGNLSGDALALDATNGNVVWRFHMGGGVRSQPIAYEIDGQSYVAIGSGSFATMDSFGGGPNNTPEGNMLFVFAVPK